MSNKTISVAAAWRFLERKVKSGCVHTNRAEMCTPWCDLCFFVILPADTIGYSPKFLRLAHVFNSLSEYGKPQAKQINEAIMRGMEYGIIRQAPTRSYTQENFLHLVIPVFRGGSLAGSGKGDRRER